MLRHFCNRSCYQDVSEFSDVLTIEVLNYRFIAQTIAELNFTGYFAHEYTPAPGKDPIASLKRALEICDV
jgi:hypothetical protein